MRGSERGREREIIVPSQSLTRPDPLIPSVPWSSYSITPLPMRFVQDCASGRLSSARWVRSAVSSFSLPLWLRPRPPNLQFVSRMPWILDARRLRGHTRGRTSAWAAGTMERLMASTISRSWPTRPKTRMTRNTLRIRSAFTVLRRDRRGGVGPGQDRGEGLEGASLHASGFAPWSSRVPAQRCC